MRDRVESRKTLKVIAATAAALGALGITGCSLASSQTESKPSPTVSPREDFSITTNGIKHIFEVSPDGMAAERVGGKTFVTVFDRFSNKFVVGELVKEGYVPRADPPIHVLPLLPQLLEAGSFDTSTGKITEGDLTAAGVLVGPISPASTGDMPKPTDPPK